MTAKLTQKQENFCKAFIEIGNASEAYRKAYDAKKMTPESIRVAAFRVMENANVTQRLAALRETAAKRHAVTVDTLIGELEQARVVALGAENPQTSAAVSATMGKAKLMGLDKQLVEISGGLKMTLAEALRESESS